MCVCVCVCVCVRGEIQNCSRLGVLSLLGTGSLLFSGSCESRFLFCFNVYSFLKDRERQSISRGGAEREGDTESEAGSRLGAVSTEPEAGLELMNGEIMT